MNRAICLLAIPLLAACQQEQLTPAEQAAKDRAECQAQATAATGSVSRKLAAGRFDRTH